MTIAITNNGGVYVGRRVPDANLGGKTMLVLKTSSGVVQLNPSYLASVEALNTETLNGKADDQGDAAAHTRQPGAAGVRNGLGARTRAG